MYSVQISHYPPGNHHASHFWNFLFQGYNHMLTTGGDDPSLSGTQAIIKVLGNQYQCLANGYDLEIGQF